MLYNAIQQKSGGKKFAKKSFCLLIIFLFFLSSNSTHAQGNLMITPRRVVFEGFQKTQELNLANTGADTARYLISMIEIRMKQDGTFEQISQPDSGQNFASSYIRFFPRSVVLAPGEVQAVKLQITRPNELKAGEYRSHIYFRAVPSTFPLGESEDSATESISVHLTPVFGISIPVIIKIGEPNVQVSVSDISIESDNDSKEVVHFVFQRAGNMSSYGDIKIDYISPLGKATKICEVKGVAVYTPTTSRRITLNLSNTSGIDLHKGKLHITYNTPEEKKSMIIAEADYVLL